MKRDNLVALIMAGGRGERLWPHSTSSTPKHLLRFGGKKVMLEETIDRLKSLVSLKKIFIITGRESARSIRRIYPGFPSANIIIEPYPRNTAACIGLASIFIKKRFPEAILSVFPSDHVIRRKRRFLDTLRFGASWAKKENVLVTLGMKPDRPETGLGYIELGKKMGERNRIPIHRVKRFVEKPDLKNAKKFVSKSTHLWNAGMFIFKIEEILKCFRLFMPGLYGELLKIEAHLSNDNRDEVIKKVYKNLKDISIDYGIMEKAHNRLVVAADFFWNDVGSWISLEELYSTDTRGNISLGDTLSLDTSDSILVSDKGLIATIGLKDIAVVSTKKVTIVFPKDKAQEVKKIVRAIRKKRSFKKYL